MQVPLVNIASGLANSRSSSDQATLLDTSLSSVESVELGSLWQRVDQHKWMVGLGVHNRTSRLVDYLWCVNSTRRIYTCDTYHSSSARFGR